LRYLQQALRPLRADIRLLPNAIDLSLYPFKLRSNPRPNLVWLRAFHGIYNPCMAPRTVAELVQEFPKIQLSMYGPDKEDGSLERVRTEVGRLKLEAQVRMPGAVPKIGIPKALNSGDIFLNTTNYESFGVSVMEAAACGLCVVSTNVGELPLLWKDGHDAILVQRDDSKPMAAAVRRILLEPRLAEHLSHNARAKSKQFDWSVILPQWEQVLIELAAKGPQADGPRTKPCPLAADNRQLAFGPDTA
jgi:glycosyltransferase involved in cell wall biosynthesis